MTSGHTSEADDLDFFECTKPVTSSVKGRLSVTIVRVGSVKKTDKAKHSQLYCELYCEGEKKDSSRKMKGNLEWMERYDFTIRSFKSKLSLKLWSERTEPKEGKPNHLPFVVARHLFDFSKHFRSKESMANERVMCEGVDGHKGRAIDIGFVWAQEGTELKRLAFSRFERYSSFHNEQKGVLKVGVLELKMDPHGNTEKHAHNHSLLTTSGDKEKDKIEKDKDKAQVLFRESPDGGGGGGYTCVVDCQDQRANSKPAPYQAGSLVFGNFTAKFNIEKMDRDTVAKVRIQDSTDDKRILTATLPLIEVPYEEREGIWVDAKDNKGVSRGKLHIKWCFQRYNNIILRVQELVNAPDISLKFVVSNGIDKVEYETKKGHFHWGDEDSVTLPLRPSQDIITIALSESGAQKGFIEIHTATLQRSFDDFVGMRKVVRGFERTKARLIYHTISLDFPDDTMDPEENYQHLLAQTKPFQPPKSLAVSNSLSPKKIVKEPEEKQLGTLIVRPLYADHLQSTNCQISVSCQGDTRKTAVVKGTHPQFDDAPFFFPVCVTKNGPISLVVNEMDGNGKVVNMSRVIYHLQSITMFDHGISQKQFYLNKKSKQFYLQVPKKESKEAKETHPSLVVHFEWDSVDLEKKLKMVEELAADKEEEKVMKETTRAARAEQAQRMAVTERKELEMHHQKKIEQLSMSTGKNEKRRSQSFRSRASSSSGRRSSKGITRSPDVSHSFSVSHEDISRDEAEVDNGAVAVEELELDENGQLVEDSSGQLTGPFSPSTVTKEGPATIRYKVIVIGDSGVGKTGLYTRWSRGTFDHSVTTTISCDFGSILYKVKEGVVDVQIWDTAGQERHHAVTKSYLRDSHGAILVYDISSLSSFIRIKRWIEDVKENSPECSFMLLGNKVDLPSKFRAVSTQEAMAFAKTEGCNFMETSAKDNINCTKAFMEFMQATHAYYTSQSKVTREHSVTGNGNISAGTRVVAQRERTITNIKPNPPPNTSTCACTGGDS